MDQSPLIPRDRWVLARLLAGYSFKEFPTSLTTRGENLARQLMVINIKDRELLIKRNVTQEEHRAIMLIDSESSIPAGGDPSKLWTVLHAKELKNLPPVSWLIEGEIPEAGLTVLYGESGAGKSFIGVDYALTVAQKHRVVYVPTEGEAGYQKRIWAWCDHHKLTEGDLYFILGTVNLFEKESFAELLKELKRLNPALVVFDTLALAMSGGDENSARDMGLVLTHCRRIIHTTRSSVVLVHHVGKGGNSERGSSALRGNADVMVKVSPSDDLVLVECSKTKDEKPFERRYLYMLPVGDSLVPVSSDQVIRSEGDLTQNQRKLLDLLAMEANRTGITTRDMEAQTGISLATTIRTLSNLLKKGLVKKKGRYTITEAGLQAIGLSDPARSTSESPVDPTRSTPEQALIQADPPSNPLFDDDIFGSAGSTGSSGSTLKSSGSDVDQTPLIEVPKRKELSKLGYG